MKSDLIDGQKNYKAFVNFYYNKLFFSCKENTKLIQQGHMDKKEKINILIIGIGLSLILLIGLFFSLKPLFSKKEIPTSVNEATYVKNLKKAKKITSEDLRKKLILERNVVILDVRDEISFSQEHIADSVNIPFLTLEQSLGALDKTKTYVLVDDGTSFEAAYAAGGIFDENSFLNAFYLSGGFIAWKNKANLTVSFGDPNSFIDQSKVNYISSDDLKKITETESDFYVIDVREKSQFNEGHIKNATNIPLNNIEKDRKNIPSDKKIIIYDENTFMAFQAGVRLYDLGFLNVKVLSDGIKTWKEKGYEIIK